MQESGQTGQRVSHAARRKGLKEMANAPSQGTAFNIGQGALAGLATNSIFFLFPFCENSLICLEGKSMTPHRGNPILFRSSQQLPGLRLDP